MIVGCTALKSSEMLEKFEMFLRVHSFFNAQSYEKFVEVLNIVPFAFSLSNTIWRVSCLSVTNLVTSFNEILRFQESITCNNRAESSNILLNCVATKNIFR